MESLVRVLTGRLTAWLVLVAALLLTGALSSAGAAERRNVTQALPGGSESARVAELRTLLPSGELNPALVVYSRGGAALTEADERLIAADSAAFARHAAGGRVGPPVLPDDRAAALVAVPLRAGIPVAELATTIEQLRAITSTGRPAGLTTQVTGGAGFTADIAESFQGANTTLLLVTVAVVTALLLVTYRSPWLWIVPLAVVGAADGTVNGLLALLSRTAGLPLDETTTGIVDVLVFGAGTDYALLLIARYREELRQHADRRDALRSSVRATVPVIAASALTVCLGLLTLLAAPSAFNRTIGIAGAIGVATAALFGLTVLPAALAVCGRGLFWPFIPRPGQAVTTTGVWARLGDLVTRRPRTIVALSLVVLAVLSAGLAQARVGLSRTEQFRVQAESLDGFATLERHFPAGAADPAVVLARQDHEQAVLTAVTATPGVDSARPTERAAGWVAFDVVLRDAPDTTASYDTIRALRAAVHAVPGAEAAVGGTVAGNLDKRASSIGALRTVVPLVLLVVLAVLIVLLRSLLAPILLMLTVVATYFGALGAATVLFVNVLGFPGLDNEVPLLSFIFLVALGVDHNIFLATRALEEAPARGTRGGMRVALTATGGVITSAGILLAAVFAVLGVLPLVTLTELGIVVGIGVLLDTLLVRTLLVPAIAMVLGDRFWWPGRLRWPGRRFPGPGRQTTAATSVPM
ncbi:MMPL family transporter [Dactylosporangium sp. AC04546]|uniref:MMPL family transporter n=1 Tax=Dactylosporangium sp. AC04546 TaxID=2862460 RepID=UPI001EDCBA11|nr:MMPL family transporter [Dactylosporangium sp. AC04546]WVK79300.1 MMPL family transporter [Dactylosporangium sp. AC04546]